MKIFNKYTILSFFFILSISVLGQKEMEVTYTFAFKPSNYSSDKQWELKEEIQFSLLTDGERSLYFSVDNMENEGDTDSKMMIILGGKGVYYTSIRDSIKLKQNSLLGHDFLIKSKLNEYKWVLINERKQIGKYNCFKAYADWEEYNPIKKRTLTNRIIVWYTPDIPIPFGPAGYDGLPGLVIESERGGSYLLATNIQFKKSVRISEPTKGEKVDIENYPNILYSIAKKEFGFE